MSLADSKFHDFNSYTSYNLTMKLGHPLSIGNHTQIILYRPNKITDCTIIELSSAMSNATMISDDTFISKNHSCISIRKN